MFIFYSASESKGAHFHLSAQHLTHLALARVGRRGQRVEVLILAEGAPGEGQIGIY